MLGARFSARSSKIGQRVPLETDRFEKMSRIGKKPVQIPAGITATVDGQKVTAKGPKGELFFVANDEIKLALEDNAISVTPVNESKDARSKWGMSRTMIENILKGVKDGFE